MVGDPVPQSPVSSAPTVPMDRDVEEAGPVVSVSQPLEQVDPVAGEGAPAPVVMVVDPEPDPPHESPPRRIPVRPRWGIVAVMEETRQAVLMVSASCNHVVQHAEVRVRQQACVSSGDGQVSAAKAARACVTGIHDTPAEEGIDEDEVEEEVRPEGYLSRSPEGDSRGFRDPFAPRTQSLPY